MSALLIEVMLKGSILMIAAAAAVVLLYRASAATRHFVWTLTVVGLLLLPVFSSSLPRWKIAVPIAPNEVTSLVDEPREVSLARSAPAPVTNSAPTISVAPESRGSIAARVPWLLLAAVAYVLGLLALLIRLVVQRRAARQIVREATVVNDRGWTTLLDECAMRIGGLRPVTVLRSRVQLMPMTMGTVAPCIVVPADADGWDEDRRRAVLLHELAHIARHDCLTQMLSAVVCAMYWVHPGAWFVARRLRIERELACDDRVLATGTHAPDYAGHLLELAYGWSGRRAPALVVGMASSRKLEGRMRAVLDPARNRTAPGRRMWLAGAALGAALLLPLAAMTMTTASADARSELMGSSSERDAQPQERASANAPEQSIGSPDNVAGTWRLRPARSRDQVQIEVTAGAFSANGSIPASELEGLTSQPIADVNGPVKFNISREAGTLEVEGTITNGTGSGTFRFVPSDTFIAGLTRRGFSRPNAQQLFALAQNDIRMEFIDELAAQKYERPEIENLVRASHHGVDTDFVREMSAAGYRVGTLDTLIRMRDHGVDPDYVLGMRAHGVSGLSPDDIVRARDHGIDPDYIGDLRSLGYDALPIDRLIRVRDHGVEGEYLRGMRQLGYSFTLDEAIRARDHGVDPEFAGDMRTLGFTLAVEDLIRARDHGATPDYIEMMAAVGYKGLPIETMIRLRDHGVTPDYVIEARKAGHDKLSAEEIIRLRDRGDGLERKLGQFNYHVDRLLAEIERALDRLLQ